MSCYELKQKEIDNPMNDNQISQIAKLVTDFERWSVLPYEIYHYTDLNTIPKIVLKNAISLRMTKAEDLDDHHEGRHTIEVYYDLALEQLLNDGIINKDLFHNLCTLEVPTELLYLFESSSAAFGKSAAYDTYITCFSTQKNDPYMISNYIRNSEHKGYCISFYSDNVKENQSTFNTLSVRLCLEQVLYGNQIIKMLYDFIKRLVHIIPPDSESTEKWIKPLVLHGLSKLRYFVKLKRYYRENEVRLALMIPNNVDKSISYISPFTVKEEKGKKYIIVPFQRIIYAGMTQTASVTNEEDNRIRAIISQNRIS